MTKTYLDDVDKFPRDGSTGSGSTPAYSVEARVTGISPIPFGEMILDDKWRRVHFDRVKPPAGIPDSTRYEAAILGLVGWPAANALRWWLHATPSLQYCLETRIIKHLVEHSYKETIVSAHDVVTGENKGSFMPVEDKPFPPLPKEEESTWEPYHAEGLPKCVKGKKKQMPEGFSDG